MTAIQGAAAVTGAASGIGRALAMEMAARGCDLALADRDEAGLQAVAADIAKAHTGTRTPKVTLHRVDVGQPDQIEAFVHHAGLEVQRRLFRALIEKADQELVLCRRHGKAGAGIQRLGTRPFTFKTIFGEVTVQRARVRHNHDGSMEVPSARAWGTPHQLAITSNLRDAVRDQMADQSAGKSRRDVCESAGDEDLLGRGTILEIVHREGERLIAAQRQRARSILDGGPEAQLAWLGPPLAEVVTDELSDVPPCDESDEDQAE